MDVRRIVEIIVEEMAAAGVAPRQHACSCHGFLYDCCPDRVRGVLDAGASRLGLHASGARPGDVAALIDHTLLKPDASRRDIETLCREAADFGFATVCINPCWVRAAAKRLRGSRTACLHRRRLPAGGDDGRRQALRDSPRDLRRRRRDRHGDQHRRPEVRGCADRRTRYRGGHVRLPRRWRR